MIYKFKAYNEHKSFFIKNGGIDIFYTSKQEARQFYYSILGIFTELLGYKLQIIPIDSDLIRDLKKI
jgi:hypothetical protein